MNIFLDANVLVSVLNKEYPLFTYSSRIISLADQKGFRVFTTPVCLAIAFYFAEKKYKKLAKEKIKVLSEHLDVAAITPATVRLALQNPAVHDFEDGLEYYAAVESKCHCIVTEDRGDFYFSDLEVLTCEDFFGKYMKRKKS